MRTRAKQVLIVVVGVLAALVMIVLGLWQMQVFVDQGNRSVEARAAQDPVLLTDHLGSDQEVGDIYGKPVIIEGHYEAAHQLLIPTGDGFRVLTAFEIADGRLLPVVRGLVATQEEIPAAPSGEVVEQGIFLPGEGNVLDDRGVPVIGGDGQLPSVRMPSIAQVWPDSLVPGFVTLDEADAAEQGLAAAPVSLPAGEGSARNSGYALQWWVFAAFALGMSITFAHNVGVRERRRLEAAAVAATGEEVSV